MKQPLRIYTFFLLLAAGLSAQAQVGLPLVDALEKRVPAREVFALKVSDTSSSAAIIPSISALLTAPIPQAYNFEELGAFCKWEVQLEKKFRLPVKVRLGEVQYTEWLEYKAY